MPDENEGAGHTNFKCVVVQLTPAQLNEGIEESLNLLKPALEGVCDEMIQLKEEMSNGKFSLKKMLEKAKKVLGLS